MQEVWNHCFGLEFCPAGLTGADVEGPGKAGQNKGLSWKVPSCYCSTKLYDIPIGARFIAPKSGTLQSGKSSLSDLNQWLPTFGYGSCPMRKKVSQLCRTGLSSPSLKRALSLQLFRGGRGRKQVEHCFQLVLRASAASIPRSHSPREHSVMGRNALHLCCLDRGHQPHTWLLSTWCVVNETQNMNV